MVIMNGKSSSLLFWIYTRDALIFHVSRVIKWPTFHLNIPRPLSFIFLFFFFFVLLLLPSSGGSWGFCCCTVLSSGVEKIPAIRMSEHVLQHGAWWEKQTLHHMKPSPAFLDKHRCGPFVTQYFSVCFQFSLTADYGVAVWGILSCFAVQLWLRGDSSFDLHTLKPSLPCFSPIKRDGCK